MTELLVPAWDTAADKLDRYPFARERVRYAVGIKPVLSLAHSARILEAGCGSGRLLRVLDALGYHDLVGLEISPQRLECIRRRGPGCARLVADEGVPFEPQSFDAVISTGVIEHVAAPEAWLGKLAASLRSGGVLSITSDTYIWRWLQRLGLYHTVQPIDRAIWPPTIIRWGRQAGLGLEAFGGFYNSPDQRYYFVRQLARLGRGWRRLRWYINRGGEIPEVPADEVEAILAAIDLLPRQLRTGLWNCVWSYESFFWFRKR